MVQCEGIDPKRTVTVRKVTSEGMVEEEEVIPEHACEEEATILARSMDEKKCNLGELHWVKTEDHVYCAQHYIPGVMKHFDKSESQHGPMSVDDG